MSERYLLYGACGVALAAWLAAFLVSRQCEDLRCAVQTLGRSYAVHLSNGGHVHTEEALSASE